MTDIIPSKLTSWMNPLRTQWASLCPQLLSLLGQKSASDAGAALRFACDFGQSKIVFLEMQINQGQAQLVKCQKITRPAEKEKLSEAFTKALKEGGFQNQKVRISVKGQGVVVRFIQFPKMKPEELRSAIVFEAEKFIPFKSEEVILDFAILEEDVPSPHGAMMNLLLVAVKREEIYSQIQFFQSVGLTVDLIDIDALANLNAVQFLYPETVQSSVGILDVGAEISTLTIVRDGKPRFIRDISYGGIDLLKRLKRKLGLTDDVALKVLEGEQAASPETLVVLQEGLANLAADLKVSMDYYMDQSQTTEKIQKIFLGGGASCHPAVIETLSKDLGVSVQTIDVLAKLQLAPGLDGDRVKKDQGVLPVALGLCLRNL